MICLQSCPTSGTMVFSVTKYSLSPWYMPGKGTPQRTHRTQAPHPHPLRAHRQGAVTTCALALRPAGESQLPPTALGTNPEGIKQDESPNLESGRTQQPLGDFPAMPFLSLQALLHVLCGGYCAPRPLRRAWCPVAGGPGGWGRRGGAGTSRGTVPGLKHLPPCMRFALPWLRP